MVREAPAGLAAISDGDLCGGGRSDASRRARPISAMVGEGASELEPVRLALMGRFNRE